MTSRTTNEPVDYATLARLSLADKVAFAVVATGVLASVALRLFTDYL